MPRPLAPRIKKHCLQSAQPSLLPPWLPSTAMWPLECKFNPETPVKKENTFFNFLGWLWGRGVAWVKGFFAWKCDRKGVKEVVLKKGVVSHLGGLSLEVLLHPKKKKKSKSTDLVPQVPAVSFVPMRQDYQCWAAWLACVVRWPVPLLHSLQHTQSSVWGSIVELSVTLHTTVICFFCCKTENPYLKGFWYIMVWNLKWGTVKNKNKLCFQIPT